MTVMSMPKATVNEDHCSKSVEHQIGSARQIAGVKSVTEAERM
jgi:hypothetical protein